MTTSINPLHVAILLIVCFLAQFGSHYLPWAQLFSKRKLPRLVAYAIGVTTLNVTLQVYALLTGQALPMWLIWCNTGAGGLGVGTGYLVDWALSKRNKAEIAEMLEDQRHASYDNPERR